MKTFAALIRRYVLATAAIVLLVGGLLVGQIFYVGFKSNAVDATGYRVGALADALKQTETGLQWGREHTPAEWMQGYAIQVADQVTGDGGWQITPGIRHHEHAVCGQILFHFNQKRGDAVAAGIQLGLLGKRHKGKQCGIAGIPRYAERVPPRSNAG